MPAIDPPNICKLFILTITLIFILFYDIKVIAYLHDYKILKFVLNIN